MKQYYNYLHSTSGIIYEFYKSSRLNFLDGLLHSGLVAGEVAIELMLKLVYYYDLLDAKKFTTETIDGELCICQVQEAEFDSFCEETIKKLKDASHNLLKTYNSINQVHRSSIDSRFEEFTKKIQVKSKFDFLGRLSGT